MTQDKWLAERLAYLRGLNAPSDQQRLLLMLADKPDRTADEEPAFLDDEGPSDDLPTRTNLLTALPGRSRGPTARFQGTPTEPRHASGRGAGSTPALHP